MSEHIRIKDKAVKLRGSIGQEIFDRACETFLLKFKMDHTGKKAKFFLKNMKGSKVNPGERYGMCYSDSDVQDLKSQDVQDWVMRIKNFQDRTKTSYISDPIWQSIY